MQQQFQDYINSHQHPEHSDQTLTINNSATVSRTSDDHLINSPDRAGTINLFEKNTKEVDNEDNEDDLMTKSLRRKREE